MIVKQELWVWLTLLFFAVAGLSALAEPSNGDWADVVCDKGRVECSGVNVQYYVPVGTNHTADKPDELWLRFVNETDTAKWVVFNCGIILADTTRVGGDGYYGAHGLKPHEKRNVLEHYTTKDSGAINYKKDADGYYLLNSATTTTIFGEFYYLDVGFLAVLDLPLPPEKEPVNEGSTNFFIASAGRYYSPMTDGVRCKFDYLFKVRNFSINTYGAKPVPVDYTKDGMARPLYFPGPGKTKDNPPNQGQGNPLPSQSQTGGSARDGNVDVNKLTQSFTEALDKGINKVDSQQQNPTDDANEAVQRFQQGAKQVQRSLQSSIQSTEQMQATFRSIQNQLQGQMSSGGTGNNTSASQLNNTAGAQTAGNGFTRPPPKFPPPRNMRESYEQSAAQYRWAAQQYRTQGNNVKAKECDQMAAESEQQARSLQGSSGQAFSNGQ